MPRQILVQHDDGSAPILTETLADSEAQLQALIKDNPDLLPMEDLGFSSPFMVAGRETSLASGAVDLVGMTRSGELLLIEFKTGPQNADFRHSLAQLLDYGSDLWGMSYEEFKSTVAVRYFNGDRCRDPKLQGKSSVQSAALATWTGMTEETVQVLRDRVNQQLASGSFEYILVRSGLLTRCLGP